MSLSNAKDLLGAGKYTKIREFTAGGTIVAGRTVALAIAGSGVTDEERAFTVIEGTATDATSSAIVGIALEAAVSGGTVRVATAGYVEGALTDGSVTIGLSLISAAGGALTPYLASETRRPIGIALETDSGTTCDVFLHDLYPGF